MLSNEEDDENQYMGLVARSRSSYAPPREANSSAPPVPPAPAASSSSFANAVVPALERRTSSTISFPPRTSSATFAESREPYADSQQVNITPLLLRKMQSIILITSDASCANRVNRHQAALASRRMKLISTTLRQIPHPAPSPRLLTALQSLCLLVRQCAFDAAEDDEAMLRIRYGPEQDPLGPAQCWPALLCQHFTCRLLFRNAYRRLWSAWRLYSPMELEREDEVAESKDRNVNVDAMLRLLFAAQDGCALEKVLSAAQLDQYKRDMLAYYQRRQMSPWRILYRQLKPTKRRLDDGQVLTANSPDGSPPASSSSSSDAASRDFRFRVLPTIYSYNGVPVVVKAFSGAVKSAATAVSVACSDDDDAETEAAAMAHAAEFLQDVACRCVWCHPHVVGCLGAYTEKFVSAATTTTMTMTATDTATTEECSTFSLSVDPKLLAGESVQATGSGPRNPAASPLPPAHHTDLPWVSSVDTLSGKPVMALGYVTELQASTDGSTLCATLGDMLFPSASPRVAPAAVRHYFTLNEALDICAQMADALQYILEDGSDVPAAVRTAWLTLDPANVYVVRTIPAAAASANPLEPRQPSLGGRETTAATAACVVRGDGTRTAGQASRSASNGDIFSVTPSVVGKGSARVAGTDSGAHTNSQSYNGVDGVAVPTLMSQEHTSLLQPSSRRTAHVDPVSNFAAAAGEKGDLLLTAEASTFVDGSAAAASSSPPQCRSQRFVVRFCPPTDWTRSAEVGGSRWRPHPRATAPASYAVVQLFLALITRQVPYAGCALDSEVQRRVFDIAAPASSGNVSSANAATAAAAAGVQVKLSSSGQGYSIPSSLPPDIAQWCRRALSLDRSQPPMELETLRDALTAIQASLSDEVENPAPSTHSVPRSSKQSVSSREMSLRMDSAFA
jgi:hypothetical protein